MNNFYQDFRGGVFLKFKNVSPPFLLHNTARLHDCPILFHNLEKYTAAIFYWNP